MSKSTKTIHCPCNSEQQYKDCCQPFHQGMNATNPTELMRSRYSAYVLNELNYLLQTWHPSTRPAQLEPNPIGLKWVGLTIKQTHPSTQQVHFVASYKLQGRLFRLEEISEFVVENQRWYYVTGQIIE